MHITNIKISPLVEVRGGAERACTPLKTVRLRSYDNGAALSALRIYVLETSLRLVGT